MAGFDWNQLYTVFKARMGDASAVGRGSIPKNRSYPYTDLALTDNTGGNYDLSNHEGTQTPVITVTVYCDNYDDATCQQVSVRAKEIMLSYGFQCIFQPIKIDNDTKEVSRWIARYRRTFGAGDELSVLEQ